MADSSNLNYIYTIGGYATLIGIGYVIYHVSTQKEKKRAFPAKAVKPSQQESRKEDRKRRQRVEETPASEIQELPAGTRKARSKAAPAEPKTWANVAQSFDTSDDGLDNREFAKQIAKAREGAKLSAKADGAKQREKSVKQSHASQMQTLAEVQTSPSSSTTGADADDDQSPISSPAAAPADTGGVADMLEPAPRGPSILRLTETGSQKQEKKPAKAPAPPAETKKQRQNKKKAEAAKLAREESEKERKVLEERQRRTARIAEGRAAKDGSQSLAQNGNKSAWSQRSPNGASGKAADVGTIHQPLDTFEPTPAATTKPPPSDIQTEEAWMSSLPSEEEQLERLKEETDDWNTVQTKSSKKTSGKVPSGDSTDEQTSSRSANKPRQVNPSMTKPSQSFSSKSFGSFSALSSKDEPAEDAEEEWEV